MELPARSGLAARRGSRLPALLAGLAISILACASTPSPDGAETAADLVPEAVPADPQQEPAAPSPTVAIVLRQGDRPAGGSGFPIASLGIATTDGEGRLGVAGILTTDSGSEAFVWRDDAIHWRASEVAGTAPANPSPLMGLGDQGQFVFQTAVEDADAVWSQSGLLLREGEAAPGIEPPGLVLFSRWTTMTPAGTAHWVSEFRDGPGAKGRARALFRSAGATPAATVPLLRDGDLVDGLPIARRGLALGYQVSDNEQHLIQVMTLVSGSVNDNDVVYVDGHIALREGDETGDGDRWHRFGRVAIDDDGHYLVSGETDGPNPRDAVLVYDGEVALREGSKVGGAEILPQASVLALSLDNQGRAAHLWSVGGFGAEHLFFACDASRLDRSMLLATSKRTLDLDPSSPVAAIYRFSNVGHGPALWLGPGDELFVAVELVEKVEDPPAGRDKAILRFTLPDCAPEVADSPAES